MATEKTLSEHAAYELEKAGLVNHEDPDARKVASDTAALVKRFEKQEHTDKTGPYVLEAFETLCTRLPLSPLTDDPDEWEKFEVESKNVDTGEKGNREVWQSRRAPSVFSEDGGKTAIDQRTGKSFELVDHKQLKKEQEEKKKKHEEKKPQPEKPAAKPTKKSK